MAKNTDTATNGGIKNNYKSGNMEKFDITSLPGFKNKISGFGQNWSEHSGEEVQEFIERNLSHVGNINEYDPDSFDVESTLIYDNVELTVVDGYYTNATIGKTVSKISSGEHCYAKIYPSVTIVSIAKHSSGSQWPNGMILFVDDNDIVVGSQATHTDVSAGKYTDINLQWPDNAVAAYVSSSITYPVKARAFSGTKKTLKLPQAIKTLSSDAITTSMTLKSNDFKQHDCSLGKSSKWYYFSGQKHVRILIDEHMGGTPDGEISIDCLEESEASGMVGFVKSIGTPANNAAVDYCDGCSRIVVQKGEPLSVKVPSDATALILTTCDGDKKSISYGVSFDCETTKGAEALKVANRCEKRIEDAGLDTIKSQLIQTITIGGMDDITSQYPISNGYMNASIGNAIAKTSNAEHRFISIPVTAGATHADIAKFKSDSKWPNGMVLYVDDNDVVIGTQYSVPGSNISHTEYTRVQLSWPDGAAKVYINSSVNLPPKVYVQKSEGPAKVPVIGDLSELLCPEFPDLAALLKATMSELPNYLRLRFLHWNVGNFGNGAETNITDERMDEKRNAFRSLFADACADVACFCEWRSNMCNTDDTIDAHKEILSQYQNAAYGSNQTMFYGKAMFSNLAFENVKTFSTSGGRNAVEADVVVNGFRIKICECHFEWRTIEDNNASIASVINRYQDEERVVILGDINVFKDQEEQQYKPFIDAGYEIANFGYFGRVMTSFNNGMQSNALDNIIVKGGHILTFKSIFNAPSNWDGNLYPDISTWGSRGDKPDVDSWFGKNLSDHFPIVADIVFAK